MLLDAFENHVSASIIRLFSSRLKAAYSGSSRSCLYTLTRVSSVVKIPVEVKSFALDEVDIHFSGVLSLCCFFLYGNLPHLLWSGPVVARKVNHAVQLFAISF